MTFHDERIVRYLERFPYTKTKYVAQIFGVEPTHVSKLRKQCGAFAPRKAAAVKRNMNCADLDAEILAAVYKRGLVDMVLDGGA
ncbi:hypothetical protein [Ensifer aridi]|uniref:hypothetical protein n=1 Tax=Ensifer aridi TaxID=1708715 RepID=UPI000A0F5446|nr:hypothetical protein [Ensifer aridi]